MAKKDQGERTMRGRPMKYRHLIENLEDEKLYSAGAIVRNAIAKGLLDEVPDEEKKVRQRVRHTMSRFAHNHGFPKKGDGLEVTAGQPPRPGWRGATWKAALQQGKRKNNL